MKKQKNQREWTVLLVGLSALALSGCSTVGSAASDLGLAGAGGVAGYQLSGHKLGGAAAGATVGYVASKVAQSEVKTALTDAEQHGYDRAMNQAVKQQYWIVQEQQKSRETTGERPARLVAVVIPESKINGVIQNAHIEYLRIENP
ncbi:MAG: hypothetical protein ABI318_06535 [Chthoniobacteraceae bacterium]